MSNKPTTLASNDGESDVKSAKNAVQSKGRNSRNSTSSRDSSQCTSPTKTEEKRLPPIKAPVGLAKGPDLKNVKSKIGSFGNVKHKPTGGERKVVTQKLEWKAKSKIGSMDNAKHKPGGGEVKVETKKLEWKAGSKIGSLDNVKHKPGGGDVKIFDEKYARSSSELSSSHPLRTPSPASSTKSIPKTPPPSTASKNSSNGQLPGKVSNLSLADPPIAKQETNENQSKTNGLPKNTD